VDIDDLADDRDVMPAIAEALGLDPRRVASGRQLAFAAPLGDATILILDNFDHRLGSRLGLLGLLEHTAGLQVLVTCRGPLRLRGEHTMLIEPLALPPEDAGGDLSSIGDSTAVQLFVDAVRRRVPGFQLNADNARVVSEIVTRLDGLPLALELAAAQSPVMTPAELLADIERGPGLLRRLPADVSGRQGGILDAVRWAEALLTLPQRQLLRTCCEFDGWWTAADLCERAGMAPTQFSGALELLGPLVRCGFVRRLNTADGGSRFSVLNLVRRAILDEEAHG
jgi:predicted ATPase